METLNKNPKYTAICCLLICLNTLSNAQNYYGTPPPPPSGDNQMNRSVDDILPTGYISVNFGFAIPEGSFANATGGNYGGYALPGDAFHFSLGIPINHSNFGVAFMFGSYSNQYDLNTYANNNVAYSIYPDENYYSESSIMGGLYVTYPVGVVSFDGRVMIGVLLNSLPEQNYGFYDAEGNNYDYDLQASNSTSFCFDAGVGVRCLIAQFSRRRKLCAMINVDYMGSSVPYNTEQNQYEIPVAGPNAGYQVQIVPSPVYSGNFSLELLNITCGIGYQF